MTQRWMATEDECGYRWQTSEQPGPHVCQKEYSHTGNLVDDDHRCCCGAETSRETT